jgi:lambda family phage portal protein
MSDNWTRMDVANSSQIGQGEQRAMRDRARNLDRNNSLASAVLDRAVENVVGTGIAIRPSTDSEEFNKEAGEKWQEWQQKCDLRRMHDFASIQQMTYRALKRDGDVGCILAVEQTPEGEVPKLQPMEGEYIETPAGKYGPAMIDGVELNSAGAPVRFWLRQFNAEKPYDIQHRALLPRDFVYLSNPDRFSVVRGPSQFAQSFELFDQISGYLEGTVMSAKIASYLALVIKKTNATNVLAGFSTHTNTAGQTVRKKLLEPAQTLYLEPGEDAQSFAPNQPTQNFPDAIAAFSRFVGLKFGLTIEQVLLDFSRTNYSSSRAARLQAQQTADMEQFRFAYQFVSRIYQWWLSRTAIVGGFMSKPPEEFWKHEWIPQAKPWVDPSKEIDFAERAVALGVDTRTYIAKGLGYEFNKLCEQNERDRELMEKHKLPIDAGQPTEPKAAPTEPKPDEPQEQAEELPKTNGDGVVSNKSKRRRKRSGGDDL